MISTRSLIATVLVATAAGGLRASEPALPDKLTAETFAAIKARVDLTPKDLAWQHVRWRNGFFEGLLDAQAEDKPIFYWFYTGDPRGHC
jgi:hypothetical protein